MRISNSDAPRDQLHHEASDWHADGFGLTDEGWTATAGRTTKRTLTRASPLDLTTTSDPRD